MAAVINVEPPRGFAPYPDTCFDERFDPATRANIEDVCRKLLNRQKKLRIDPKIDENKWFNEKVRATKGPLHMVSRFVKERDGEEKSFVLVLGATNDQSGKLAISKSTYDFPWFTLVMNEFCSSSNDEPFNAWQLAFDKEGHIGAKALCDETVSSLTDDEKALLEKGGFWIPGRKKGAKPSVEKVKPKKPPGPKPKDEVDPKDPLYEVRMCERRVSTSIQRIRTNARRVRMNAGMTDERRKKITGLIARLNRKFEEGLARLNIVDATASTSGSPPLDPETDTTPLDPATGTAPLDPATDTATQEENASLKRHAQGEAIDDSASKRSRTDSAKRSIPAAGGSDEPAAGGTNEPDAGIINEVAGGGTDEPAAGGTNEPAAGGTDEPAAGLTNKPAAGQTDKPATGLTNEPAAGLAENEPVEKAPEDTEAVETAPAEPEDTKDVDMTDAPETKDGEILEQISNNAEIPEQVSKGADNGPVVAEIPEQISSAGNGPVVTDCGQDTPDTEMADAGSETKGAEQVSGVDASGMENGTVADAPIDGVAPTPATMGVEAGDAPPVENASPNVEENVPEGSKGDDIGTENNIAEIPDPTVKLGGSDPLDEGNGNDSANSEPEIPGQGWKVFHT